MPNRMQRRRVVATSTSSLADYKRAHSITILPLHVHIEGKDLLDSVDISAHSFIEWMRQNPKQPISTSPPTEDEMHDLFEKMAREGCEEVICVTISAKLSETYERVATVAKYMSDRIKILPFDSESVCFSEGLLALEAERRIGRNQATTAIIKSLEFMRANNHIGFAISNLDQLVHTGRLAKSQAFLANMLKIKPILTMEAGELKTFERNRGTGKSIERLVAHMQEHMNDKVCVPFMTYAGNDRLRQSALELLHSPKMMQFPASPVVLCYAGIDLVGLGFLQIDQF